MKRMTMLCILILTILSFPLAQDVISIAEVQDTTGTENDESVYLDSTVTVTGVVSAESYAFGSDYYLQDGTGKWSGIMVYDSEHEAAYGDSIMITAEVDEYYNLTELKNVSSFTVISKGHEVKPTLVSSGEIGTNGTNAEAYEGVLVKVLDAEITNSDLGHGEWEINDGSGVCRVDDKSEYYFNPEKYDSVRSIIGVLDYSFDNTKIQPRLAYDVEEAAESIRIQRLQQIRESSVIAGDDTTYFQNEIVTVTGVVTVKSGLFYAGSGKKYYFQQPGGGPFSGLLVYDDVSESVPTVYEGDSITVTGVIHEYVSDGNTTELNATEELSLWGMKAKIDTSEVKTEIFNDSLYYTSSTETSLNYEAEKWENALIMVSNAVVDTVTQHGVRLHDETGRGLLTSIGYSDGVTMGSPPEGTLFESVTGVIYDHWGNYNFIPRYDSDVAVMVGPPMISNTYITPTSPQPEDTITVSTSILDDGSITEAKLFYSINNEAYTSVDLVNPSSSGYEVEIGPFEQNDIINYYITATDDDTESASDPEAAPDSVYSFVISGPETKTIYDIQYTENSSGDSPFNEQLVTFNGTVTSDTSASTSSFFVQDFNNAEHPEATWNGIMIYSSDYATVAIGQDVKITGTVDEYYNLTEIKDISLKDLGTTTSVTAAEVTCADIAADSASSEKYEGVLVRISDLTVVTEKDDHDDWTVTDASGEIVQIGGSDAYNYNPAIDDNIEFINGNLTFSYGKYELLLRDDADLGEVTSEIDPKNNTILTYHLSQNYPNPFNPTTTISYGIKKDNRVRLTIYNLLGQKVRTLVNASQPAGNYKVIWNGRDKNNQQVSNGIYIYRITSGNFVKTKKMILLK